LFLVFGTYELGGSAKKVMSQSNIALAFSLPVFSKSALAALNPRSSALSLAAPDCRSALPIDKTAAKRADSYSDMGRFVGILTSKSFFTRRERDAVRKAKAVALLGCGAVPDRLHPWDVVKENLDLRPSAAGLPLTEFFH
jgi:hypothetical protein